MPTQIETNRPYALAAGGGRPMVWFTSTITLKAFSPEIGVAEVLMRPGEEPPLHIHNNEDEWLYVLEGAMTFHCWCPQSSGKNGRVRFVPARDPAHLQHRNTASPFPGNEYAGRFERMFEPAPNTPEDAARALTAFGTDVVGPHPRQAATAA